GATGPGERERGRTWTVRSSHYLGADEQESENRGPDRGSGGGDLRGARAPAAAQAERRGLPEAPPRRSHRQRRGEVLGRRRLVLPAHRAGGGGRGQGPLRGPPPVRRRDHRRGAPPRPAPRVRGR